MLRIIPGSEAITVEHPVFCIYGEPGCGKTSLAYSAKDPLLLDADQGAHRAVNRRATAAVDRWSDVEQLTNDPATLKQYGTIIPDTVGRVLDMMTVDIIERNSKMGRDGTLTLQGYGALKTKFRTWVARLRAHGLDVVLVAHGREDKDGDSRIMRPDIIGASYGEVMKVSDFVGYVYMSGTQRMLEFNPSERWVGKNPAQWPAMPIPPAVDARTFMSELMAKGREVLGQISADSSKASQELDDWRAAIAGFTTAAEFTKAVPLANDAQPKMLVPQVKKLLNDAAKAKGFKYDKKVEAFIPAA